MANAKENIAIYHTAFEYASDALLLAKGQRFIECNLKAVEIFGCKDKEEIVGKTFLDFSPEHQSDGSFSKKKGDEKIRLTQERGPQFFEWKHSRLDGTCFDADISLKKIITGGKGLHLASIRDITNRKEAEKTLRGAYAEINKLKKQLESDYTYLREEIKLDHNHSEIIGESDALKAVLLKVEQIAPTATTALILGKTGTGKELFARAIHNASPRKDRPLVKVNCATLPSNLIESELFGHEKGAFTGAVSRHIGRFEIANGTTIFLDEIGELPLALQAKLLRVLQEGEFERLGSSYTIQTDARIIAASNKNLEEEVRNARFREDLWYRLNVFPITLPPLRERKEDIPLIVNWFVHKYAGKMGKHIKSIPRHVMKKLLNYSWPGNVRELENVIERSVIISQGPALKADLPRIPGTRTKGSRRLKTIERDHIIEVLEDTYWKVAGKGGAAEILDMKPSTLRSRMERLGIKKRRKRS